MVNKIDKPLAWLMKKKSEKISTTSVRDESEDITTDTTTGIKR